MNQAQAPTRRIAYSLREVMELTGRSRWTIQRWINRGLLKEIRIPRAQRMVQADSLEALMAGEARRKA